ncbi:hypothetical protein N8198_09020 [Gammaproteobacteria bacterium]|nr:hypothetical protein [Gammaproteobacteria bacterium]
MTTSIFSERQFNWVDKRAIIISVLWDQRILTTALVWESEVKTFIKSEFQEEFKNEKTRLPNSQYKIRDGGRIHQCNSGIITLQSQLSRSFSVSRALGPREPAFVYARGSKRAGGRFQIRTGE